MKLHYWLIKVLYAGGSRRHLSNEPKDESVETKWEHLQYYESRLEVSHRATVGAFTQFKELLLKWMRGTEMRPKQTDVQGNWPWSVLRASLKHSNRISLTNYGMILSATGYSDKRGGSEPRIMFNGQLWTWLIEWWGNTQSLCLSKQVAQSNPLHFS